MKPLPKKYWLLVFLLTFRCQKWPAVINMAVSFHRPAHSSLSGWASLGAGRAPHRRTTPLFVPSPCPKKSLLPSCYDLDYFLIIIIFLFLSDGANSRARRSPCSSSLRVSPGRRSRGDGKGQDRVQAPAKLLLACNYISVVITRNIGRLGLASRLIYSLILGKL